MLPEEVGQRIERVQHALVDARILLESKYSWTENDARLTVLNKCSSVLITINLGYIFIHQCLSKERWWRASSTLPIDLLQMSRSGNEFEMFLRIGLIQNFLYSIESSFRIFVRAIDSNACSFGQAEFKNVYEWLFKRTELQNHGHLLDLWRNIRNTMHNNGLFMPSSGKDSTVVFLGISYDFRVGKPTPFVTTEFMVGLLPHMSAMLLEILESKEVSRIHAIPEIS